MRKTEIYKLGSPYREDLTISGYTFGHGRKSACIVGSIRGNEIQQLYVCSQIVRKLEELEASHAIASGKEILVVPSVNHHAMNIGKRFWPVDDTDINRMFPGYDQGETTQRIADSFRRHIQKTVPSRRRSADGNTPCRDCPSLRGECDLHGAFPDRRDCIFHT